MGNNLAALEVTIDALEGLTEEHAAHVEHCRTLAALVDHGGVLEAKLHGEYRQALAKLLEVGRKREIDAFAQLLEKLRDESE